MTEELLFFAWQVPDDGYRVIRSGGRSYLVSDPGLWSTIRPLDNGVLFREFANLPNDADAFVGFANQWGHLGVAENITIKRKSVPAEPLSAWTYYVGCLRRLVDMRDRVEDGHREFKFVRWPDKNHIVIRIEDEFGEDRLKIDVSEDAPARLKQFTYSDTYEPALYYLKLRTDKVLREHVSPRLMWSKGQLETRLVPDNLVGAIFYQFSRTVGRKMNHRACERCGKWFEYQRGTARYCSNTCRVYASQQRRGLT